MNNSIPLILASKSKPRRDVLFSAGICPTIRVSNVDEPAALEREAAAMGVAVSDLSVEQRVMILATAKAEAVHQAYRNVAATAAAAHGDRVIGYPLKAVAESSEHSDNVENTGDSASLEYSSYYIACGRSAVRLRRKYPRFFGNHHSYDH